MPERAEVSLPVEPHSTQLWQAGAKLLRPPGLLHPLLGYVPKVEAWLKLEVSDDSERGA